MDSRLEERFITTVVLDGEAGAVYGKIRDEWFLDAESRQAWAVISSHYSIHRESIPEEAFLEQVPGYDFLVSSSSADVEALSDALQKKFVRTKLEDILETADVSREDPLASAVEVSAEIQRLTTRVERKSGVDIAATAASARVRYRERQKNQGCIGLVWPWLPLQESTLGLQNGQYVIFYARPKNKKTWLLLFLLAHWKITYGRKILIVNRELSVDQVQDRWVCSVGEFPYGPFRKGRLTDSEEGSLDEVLEYLAETGQVFIESVYTDGDQAAMEIDGLCEMYGLEEGDILAIDGMYFYAGSSDWAMMRAFSQGIQRVAKQRKLPTLCTTQGNQNQGKQGMDAGQELGLGDGPAQDCDLAIRVAKDDEDDSITLSVTAIRDGWPTSFVINGKLCDDFSLKYSNDYLSKDKKPAQGEPVPAPTIGAKKNAKRKRKSGVKAGSGRKAKATAAA